MLQLILLSASLLQFSPSDNSILRFTLGRYNLEIAQPQGWILDTRAAPQIAHFVIHPEGTNWRRADVVIYVRFQPGGPDETVQKLLQEDTERFEEDCPYADTPEDVTLEGAAQFSIRRYFCPGVREEVLAITKLPDFFAAFLMSSQKEGAISNALPTFDAILTSFHWSERSRQ